MTAHTPEPWQLVRDPMHYDTLSTVVAGARDRRKGIDHQMIVQVGGWASVQEQEANARLIESAPKLFTAVQRLMRSFHPLTYQDVEDYNFARAAIAKAKGETA